MPENNIICAEQSDQKLENNGWIFNRLALVMFHLPTISTIYIDSFINSNCGLNRISNSLYVRCNTHEHPDGSAYCTLMAAKS